eukprot:7669946-Lingulodinium_polyedra.AAC.1
MDFARASICLDVEYGIHMFERHAPQLPQELRPCRQSTVEIYRIDGPAADVIANVEAPATAPSGQSKRWLRRKLHQ